MYEVIQPKQDAFDSACVRFANQENVEQLANECAMKPQMLRNKLNPNQPHQLSVRELILMTKASNNQGLINSVLLELDLTAVRLPAQQGEGKSPVMTAMTINTHAGDISRHICDVETSKRLTRRTKDEIVSKAQAAVRELVLLMNDVENRCHGSTPFISMCTDTVMNGLPIPGLS
ncbi:phage regulatory CII family protein [Photobacterium damselae]|uniref:phage regulatory CII family protein n=1 Tax=Photobacterium damselae TaxID=38293 RepID=UPI001EFC5FB1|nr:phage regulatory CII family protein [Photobacterium damselae]MCG9778706.1 phage regulatory CII family protein [Photobacterium damselae]